MNVDTTMIQTRIDHLIKEVEALEDQGYRLMDSRKAQKEVHQVIKNRSMAFDSKAFAELVNRADIAGKADHIARLQTTLDSDLMKVDTRYVITDGPLVSPTGFTTEDRVYFQTTIAIHTDVLDYSRIPSSNVDLLVHDLGEQA